MSTSKISSQEPAQCGSDIIASTATSELAANGRITFEPPHRLADSDTSSDALESLDLEENPRTRLQVLAILIALYASLFVAALDQTVIATAVPTIATELHASSSYAWIGSAYLLSLAATGPIWMKISDIWGRKPALLAAVLLFAAASIFAALSRSMGEVIGARAIQGIGGSGILGLVIVVISDLFSVRKRTLYIGYCEIVWALAGGTGPILGGALTEYVSWRWCFWINLPICGVSLVLLFAFLDTHNPRTKFSDGVAAFDWLGTAAIIGVTVMLLLGLDFGGVTFPWNSATVVCLIVFGVVMIGVFVFTEKSIARHPLMPFKIFLNRSAIAVLAVGFCHGLVFIAPEYYLPLYFQSVKGASPLRSGVLILPLSLPEAAAAFTCGIIMHKMGRFREVIWIGMVFMTVGTGLYILFSPSTSIATVVGVQIIGGIGSGCLYEAPIIAAQANCRQRDTAAATGTLTFMRNMATAMSLVFGGVVFQNSMDEKTPSLQAIGLNATLVDAFSGGKAAANVDLIKSIQNHVKRLAVETAFSDSLRDIWIMYTCFAVVGLVVSAFVAHSHLSTEHTETRTGLEKEDR